MKPAAPPVLRATRLLDQVRERIRYKHYSLRTEQAYVQDTAHVLTRIYLHTTNELGVLYDFIVLAPDSFIAVSDITKMKATVNLHRLAGKKPKYQYINSLQQF